MKIWVLSSWQAKFSLTIELFHKCVFCTWKETVALRPYMTEDQCVSASKFPPHYSLSLCDHGLYRSPCVICSKANQRCCSVSPLINKGKYFHQRALDGNLGRQLHGRYTDVFLVIHLENRLEDWTDQRPLRKKRCGSFGQGLVVTSQCQVVTTPHSLPLCPWVPPSMPSLWNSEGLTS